MLSGVYFRQIVSGERQGVLATLTRGMLGCLERPYQWAVDRRNLRFDNGRAEIIAAGVPVISIGNLTVGGTGKTPFVAWLATWFRERGVKVALISRGYGSRGGEQNDEARELATRLPGVPHLQNADRVAAARTARKKRLGDLLILDDAFQHRRIARDLDIVLLDALEPFGYGHLLPRGLLREPVRGLERAHVVALSRSDAVSEQRRKEIRREVERYAPRAIWVEFVHQPERLISASGEMFGIDNLKGRPVAAFCGIGNPAGFRHTLAACGFTVASLLELPDHCAYAESDLARLREWLEPLPVQYAICTRKDLVKIASPKLAEKQILALDICLEITRGRKELEAVLEEIRENQFGAG
jgi:tetraacyldisaccharide 4'-kinase